MKWKLVILILVLVLILLFINKTSASTEWNEWTYKLQAKIMKMWMWKDISAYIINRCKAESQNPRQCVIVASFISKAESNMWKNAHNNNMFGINEWKKYGSLYENFDRWFRSYQKYWYNSPHPKHYYPKVWETSKTCYCTDEKSSNSKKWCPNGRKHSEYVYYILTAL